jgi:drug/metabolite transporter (DMT)-like permease
MKLRAYLLMLFVVAVWGSTFVLVKGALTDATPAAFNLVRMTLAFAVLGVAYHRYWRTIQGWQVGAGALVGLRAWPWATSFKPRVWPAPRPRSRRSSPG